MEVLERALLSYRTPHRHTACMLAERQLEPCAHPLHVTSAVLP